MHGVYEIEIDFCERLIKISFYNDVSLSIVQFSDLFLLLQNSLLKRGKAGLLSTFILNREMKFDVLCLLMVSMRRFITLHYVRRDKQDMVHDVSEAGVKILRSLRY